MNGRVFVSDHVRLEEWSIRLHALVADKLRQDPQGVIAKARRNLSVIRRIHGLAVEGYARRWEALIAGPVEDLVRVMISPSPEARELRQCTPFAGVLTPKERWAAYRAFRAEWRRKHAAGSA